MANPFVKGWKYLMAAADAKIEKHADPKVQIQQAVEEAQRRHQLLTEQAAAVIGNQRQLELKLSRRLSEVDKLQASVRQALVLSESAQASGQEQRAVEYEQSARVFATQLVATENSVEELKLLHDQAVRSAEQARQAVADNALLLQQKLAERTWLLSQLEQAKMQEAVADSLESMSSLTAGGATPSLDEIRDKIEQRYAGAIGRAELASGTVEGRSVQVRRSVLDLDGNARLEEIRAAVGGGSEAKAVSGGDSVAARMREIRASIEGGQRQE